MPEVSARRGTTSNVRWSLVLVGVLLTACSGGGDERADDVPTAFPTRTAAGDTAGCTDGAPHHAVCWFIKSLRLDDRTGFDELERSAAVSAGLMPEGDWFVASCEALGDHFYECRVPFGGTKVGVFEVVPANASTRADGRYVAPEEPSSRYSVMFYRGSLPLD